MEKINKVFKNGEPLSAEELNGIVRYINELGETIEENLDDWSSLNAVEEMWNSLKEDDDSNRIHNSHSPLSYPLSSINGANLGLPPYSNMAITSDGNGGWLWKKVNQGGGGGSGSSSLQGINKLRTYFLNVTHGIVPSAPSVNNYNSSPQDNFINGQDVWTFTNTNPTNDQDTYAIWVWFLSNIPVNIDGPIKIFDGAVNSSNGEDGEEIEWIYRRVNTIPTNATLNTWESILSNCKGDVTAKDNKTFRNVDAVPFDWNDNPSGVTFNEKYEYASFRRSSLNSNGKRIWGETGFCRPFIWSTYGEKGIDGDGVEYIFWGKAEAVTDWDTFSQNQENAPNYPPGWTNNEGFQNNEYFGPDGSLWTDDPLGINDTTRRYIYMSKRKKVQDPLTGISSWDAFSIPVLWNLYTGTSFMSNIFKRSPTKPNKPGANEGSFLNPVPTGWSDGIPAGTDSIWITSRIFSSNGQYPQQDEWNDVQLMSDTESFDVEFSPIESNPGTPTTNPNNWYDPTTDTDADWTNMIWMATRTKSNGVWGTWNVTKIKGEKGDPGSGSTFDDTELRNAISNLQSALSDANSSAESEKLRLTNLINSLDNSIQDKVEDLLDDATWVQNNFPEGSGSSSNFGQLAEHYLQTIGFWTTDDQGNTVTQWSKLSQDVSGISSRVTKLEGSTSTGGDVDYNMLSSELYNYIQDNYATAGMDSTWAKFAQLSNGDMQMLKWMSAGAASYANDAQSVANLFAAAKDYADDGSTINLAVSDINALVERDQNNNLVAKSSMTSMVNTAITGIINTATNSQAGTTIFSKVDENSNNIAALVTKITGVESSASVASLINDMSAGVLTKADLNNATASMVANGKSVAAAIIAAVNDDTSSVHIKADKIELDGQTVANSISANNMTLTGHVQANDFQAGASNSLNIKTTGNKISFCDGATEKAYFVLEGSGLQLYIMDELGAWRKIEWKNWASTTSYTVLNLYQHTGGDDAANAFTQKNIYVANGNAYNDPDTTSGTPSGTFYVKTTPWEFISLTSSLYKLSSSVLYMWASVTRNTNSDLVDPENAYAPVFSEYIDTYVEVLITNGQLVYNENSNKYNIARQYPSDGLIYTDSLGRSTNSSRMNYSSTPIFINVDNDLLDDDYHYMYMNNVFYYKIQRNPSDYITGTCVKKVNTFNDARTTAVFSFTEFNQ